MRVDSAQAGTNQSKERPLAHEVLLFLRGLKGSYSGLTAANRCISSESHRSQVKPKENRIHSRSLVTPMILLQANGYNDIVELLSSRERLMRYFFAFSTASAGSSVLPSWYLKLNFILTIRHPPFISFRSKS